MILLQNCCH